MLRLLAALLLAAQPAPPASAAAPLGRTAWIFATIGQSEWCPAGNVRLDLRTGRYALTERAPIRTCNREGLERPVVAGRLAPARLATVRAAWRRSLAEGLRRRGCQNGVRSDGTIIVSNAGTPILLIATGAFTAAAPDDLTCWSDAATALRDRLEEALSPRHAR